jgi:hypothetical protein
MSKHTPGPWTFDIGVKGYHVYDAELCTVCTAREKQTARLIAAAPDLLAALKEISRCAAIPDEWLVPVRAAIQKAEGDL